MIKLENIFLQQGAFAFKDLNLEIKRGDYAALMGKSGCGKTTVLEVLCGLRPILSGRVTLGDREVTGLKPAERGVGYVPQDRALFPTMQVRHQLAFSLQLRRWSTMEIAARVNELADWLEIGHLLDRLPSGLSGGESQRVALGRALASQPQLLCLDEPLSALDEALRDEMCLLLSRIHRKTRITILHVTHSRAEADRLAGQLWCFQDGALRQIQ
ncbi:MAG: ABC transporter ATP-binding protein [Verrucomicrobiota bacterium]|nr:ABC transporter ATP-binding protein [Verrucomicrobiota bacterium]MDG1891558.1 ABC transporter ATP-binding protein [Verrucomicrobiota bacterium]